MSGCIESLGAPPSVPYSASNEQLFNLDIDTFTSQPLNNLLRNTDTMVRFIPGVTASSLAVKSGSDPLTDLTLLLNRLQRTILHADTEREARLKESEFEREKALRNITYARSLLTEVEQDTLAIKIHARRQDLQSDLVRKRELLDQLSERLSDLAEVGSRQNNDEEQDNDTSEGEDILAEIIVTPSASESQDSFSRPTDDEDPNEDDGVSGTPHFQSEQLQLPTLPPPPVHTHSQEPLQPTLATSKLMTAPTATNSSLRPRRTQNELPPKEDRPSAVSSSSALFGDRNNKSAPTTALSAVTTTEAILDHQRAEQDALSESILQLASQLKASSQAFSMSLEEDKEVVEKAGEGMNKTGEGMDAVTRRMTTLQRMTEGEGWWGRMRLYAIVYGLMVVLVLVVFVMPKLRF
ncbi:hypothetical protein QBC36DRAFT_334663 [Triangularia setosa]|uniref:Synaptobrevin n=1 Tax=Triangularia setosa TaxID=2587417 RepID=A0AAN6W493_9PEZI|nr:hypothetical protein QBC36DRAFT_334663 [Podospora setosa]